MAGQILELTIGDVAHGGVFVARHDGRVVFVSDAISGERVRAVVTDDSKDGFWRASVVEVLEASDARVPHIWPEADVSRDPAERPGGAEFGHIALEHQRVLKQRVIEDALRKFAKTERSVVVEPVAGESDGLHWRTRARLHRDDSGRVGPFAERTHTVVPVTSFPLFTPALEQTALALAEDSVTGNIRGYDLVDTGDGVHVLPVRPPAKRGKRAPKPAPKAPASTIKQFVGDREFKLAADGFWQVHHGAAAALTAAVRDVVSQLDVPSDAWNLDLYGGVGLLAAALADELGADARITSVEADAAATEYADLNLGGFRRAAAETGRVDRWLTELEKNISAEDWQALGRGVVVLDPPRSGAGKAVVDSLLRLAPAHIVYVACDPVALARDLNWFQAGGYELSAIRGFDLFPHTHHVETVAVLRRGAGTQPD